MIKECQHLICNFESNELNDFQELIKEINSKTGHKLLSTGKLSVTDKEFTVVEYRNGDKSLKPVWLSFRDKIKHLFNSQNLIFEGKSYWVIGIKNNQLVPPEFENILKFE